MNAVARLRVTAMTHRGAVRDGNEDCLVVGAFTACGVDMAEPVSWEMPLTGPVIVAVADGMGGHAAGEAASAHAVRTLAVAAPADAAEVTAVLQRIDAELLASSRADPAVAGLGTTVAGVLLGGGVGVWFTVGDSRIYLERGGYLAQLSVDDRSPLSGGLTQCLGGCADGAPLRPRVEPFDEEAPGQLLLCSDGLSDIVESEDMEELLVHPGGPAWAVKALWAAAMNASGCDNITIALVEVEDQPPQVGRSGGPA